MRLTPFVMAYRPTAIPVWADRRMSATLSAILSAILLLVL